MIIHVKCVNLHFIPTLLEKEHNLSSRKLQIAEITTSLHHLILMNSLKQVVFQNHVFAPLSYTIHEANYRSQLIKELVSLTRFLNQFAFGSFTGTTSNSAFWHVCSTLSLYRYFWQTLLEVHMYDNVGT